MALPPKEQKELLRLQTLIATQSEKDEATQDKIDRLLSKQNTKLSEQLGLSRSISKAADDYDKILKSYQFPII